MTRRNPTIHPGAVAAALLVAILVAVSLPVAAAAAKSQGVRMVLYGPDGEQAPYYVTADRAEGGMGAGNRHPEVGEEILLTLGLENPDQRDLALVKTELRLAEPADGVEIRNARAEFRLDGETAHNLPDEECPWLVLSDPPAEWREIPLVWVVTLPNGQQLSFPFKVPFARPGRLSGTLLWQPRPAGVAGEVVLRGRYEGAAEADRVAWERADLKLTESAELTAAGVPAEGLSSPLSWSPDGEFSVRFPLAFESFTGRKTVAATVDIWGESAAGNSYHLVFEGRMEVDGVPGGAVEVETTPPGVEVFSRRGWLGSTPVQFELPGGEHTLSLATPTGLPEEVPVRVTPGETTRVSVTVKPETAPVRAGAPLPGYAVAWQASLGSALSLLDELLGWIEGEDEDEEEDDSGPAALAAFGMVFAVFDQGTAALDEVTGDLRWQAKFDDATEGPCHLAAGYGRVFLATRHHLVAYDALSGRELWRVQTGRSKLGAVRDGLVCILNDYGNLEAYDVWTGQRRWRTTYDDGDVETAPAIVSGRFVALVDPREYGEPLRLSAWDPLGGDAVWSADLDPGTTRLAAGEEVVFTFGEDGRVAAWRFGDTSPAWRWSTPDGQAAQRAAAGEGLLAVATADGTVVALAERTGEVVWTAEPGPRITSLHLVRGLLFAARENGQLLALRSTDGQRLYQTPIPGRTKRIFSNDDRLFVVAEDLVVAFGKGEVR